MRDYPREHVKIYYFWRALHVVACHEDLDGKLLNLVVEVIFLTQNIADAQHAKVIFLKVNSDYEFTIKLLKRKIERCRLSFVVILLVLSVFILAK